MDAQRLQQKRLIAEEKVKEAFDLFDRDGKKACDVREVGTIVRSLGFNPTELQLHKMIEEMEEEEPTGFIFLERFLKVAVDILLTNEYKGETMQRDGDDVLIRAFEALDPEKKGYVEAERFRELMMSMGEQFTEEEIEELITVAADSETNQIRYEDYAMLLAYDG